MSKKNHQTKSTSKHVRRRKKTKNIIKTIYFMLGSAFMLIMILTVLGVLT